MKSSFSLELNDSQTRRSNRKYLWLLLVLSLAVASYFVLPKIITSTPKDKPEEQSRVTTKEQIIKTIALPDVKNMKEM